MPRCIGKHQLPGATCCLLSFTSKAAAKTDVGARQTALPPFPLPYKPTWQLGWKTSSFQEAVHISQTLESARCGVDLNLTTHFLAVWT